MEVEVGVNKNITKYANYFFKVAKYDKDKDLTSFVERIGFDTKEYSTFFVSTINAMIAVSANKYDEENGKFTEYKASFKQLQ